MIKETEIKEQIKRVLSRPNLPSFSKFKEMIDPTLSDELFYRLILTYLKEEVEEFKMTRTYEKNRHLKNCFHYLNYVPSHLDLYDDKAFFEEVSLTLQDIQDIIQIKLSDKMMVGPETTLDQNRDLLIRLEEECQQFFQKHRTIPFLLSHNGNEMYRFLKELIFSKEYDHYNYYSYIRNLIQNLPNTVNTQNEEGTFLLEELTHYFATLLEEDHDYNEKVRMERVLMLFLESPSLEVPIYSLSNILSKTSNHLIKQKRKTDLSLMKELLEVVNDVQKRQVLWLEKERKLKEKYHLYSDFTLDELEEIRSLTPIDFHRYIDETNQNTITIDSSMNKIKEQAIFYEREGKDHHVIFYVIDILPYLLPDSKLDERARSIAKETTKVESFLPPSFLKRHLSFEKEQVRPAIAFEFWIDGEGNLKESTIKRSIICVKKHYDYEMIGDIYLGNIGAKKLQNDIENLYYLSELLKKRGKQRIVKRHLKEKVWKEYTETGKRPLYVAGQINETIAKKVSEYLRTFDLPLIDHCYGKTKNIMETHISKYFSNQEKCERLIQLFDPAKTYSSFYIPNNQRILEESSFQRQIEISRPARSYASLLNLRLIAYYLLDDKELGFAYIQNLIDHLEDECEQMNGKRMRELYYEAERKSLTLKKENK